MTFTYLASPYSHLTAHVRERRYVAVLEVANRLMRAGECVFAPIAHSHPINSVRELPQSTEFWMAMDLPILRHASLVKVLRLDGWETSKGIVQEIEFARSLNIPIEYIDEHATTEAVA